MKRNLRFSLFSSASVVCILTAFSAQAANFTIANGVTVTATQSIGGGAGETGTVQSGGTVAVTGTNGYAITSSSANGTLTNNGTITTNGQFGFAIYSTANGNTLTNNSSITTSGQSAYGLYTNVNNNIMTNNGTITVSGLGSYGIFSQSGTGNTLSNTGSITTSNSGSFGIFSGAGNNTLTNSGSITTSGDTSFGMYASSASTNNIILNSGSINTTGNFAYGIYSQATGNTVTNDGTITTHANDTFGMASAGDSSSLTNNGTITTNGSGSFGIDSFGNNSTIINNGTVHSVNSYAIFVTGNNSALTLNSGSVVLGKILLGGTNNALTLNHDAVVRDEILFTNTGGIFNYDVTGTGSSGSVLAVSGQQTTNILNASSVPRGARIVIGDNAVAVITRDQFSGSQVVVSQTVSDVGNVVNNRQQLALLGDTTEANGGTQYAASNNSMNDSSNPNEWAVRDRKVAWAEVFGSYQERSDTADSIARSGGTLVGIDFPQTSEGVRSGFYAGGFGGTLDVGKFRDVVSTGGMVGGYVGKSYGEYYISSGLNLGFSNNDSKRFTGLDTAKTNYTSHFASPSLTVMRPIKTDGVTWVPNATLRYTVQHDDSYDETGSITNQSVDSRTSHSLDARAMIEARLDGTRIENSFVAPAFRAGLHGKTMIGSNNTDVTVLGNSLSFDPSTNDNTIDGVLGFNVSHSFDNGPQLYFDAEANLGLNHGGPSDNKGIVGRLGAKWRW